MTTKTINFLISSIFLLMFFFAVLVGQNIKPEIKPSFNDKEITGYITLNSWETITLEDELSIWHAGFSTGDSRQDIVQEAYQLGGLDFVSLIECENGQWLTWAVGDWGKAYGLCQLNTRRHKEPLAPEWKDWRNQLSICYSKRKWGTKFYWPQRLIWGKRCSEVARKRFMVAEDFTLVD